MFLVSTGGFIDRPVKRQKYPDGINVDNVCQKKTKAETFFKMCRFNYCGLLSEEIRHPHVQLSGVSEARLGFWLGSQMRFNI